ncbi:MAG: TonB-dependent receptor [Acidobacteria bacterium]|nr:TonB-dependent receptor [Acidobacteriota bacterium]
MKILSRIMPAALALIFALLATSVSAQTATTGTIEGTIADANGAVVPGATVRVSSPNLIRAQTATSDSQGRYRFANLPPGKYTVTVEAASGFAKFEQADVEVNLSKTNTTDIKLQAQGASAVVEVVAGAATVDVSNNTTGTTVTTEQFSNLPTQRTVQSLYTIAPTVARSGLRDASGRDRDPSVGGSSGPENNYILDGVTVTDPAFGGSGANLPFEFVQEVEIKTGAYGADIGKTTGGVFNVITKSGGNEFHGDVFFYGNPQKFTRETKNFPFTGAAPNGFSEIDAGFDLGGPIKKDKIWFFGAFNPQRRENHFLTQTFRQEVKNKITTPFYAGKITYGVSDRHILTFSTFSDFTKQEGFLFGGAPNDPFTGFGADPNSFLGTRETGGHNYTVRLNSTFSPRFIGEFVFGAHLQRANTIPLDAVAGTELITDNFAVVRTNQALAPVATTVTATNGLFLAYVNGTGGRLERNYFRQGFGLRSNQDRDRYEFAIRMQSNIEKHAFKYGFEYSNNRYRIDTRSTGPIRDFKSPDSGVFNGYRLTNNWLVCQVSGSNLVCPNQTGADRGTLLLNNGTLAGSGITGVTIGAVNLSTIANPFLILSTVGVRDFRLNTQGKATVSNVQSGYIQDDFKITRSIQLNLGLRWDFQQSKSFDTTYLKLNQFIPNTQPRLGFIWDFTGQGKGKFFANYARFLETPIPLDVNVRAGGNLVQTDFNIRVNRLNGPAGSTTLTDFGCLGCEATPVDPGLKPQTVNEYTAGVEYEAFRNLTFGVRGIYRAQDNVIEDGSFDDGEHYFLFNPGRNYAGSTEEKACNDPGIGCFGRARRYYRALEFTATKRFSNNWQLISSYVYSSLIGNYEGLFRNDNGQADPNITSLFDLVSLLDNAYGRLPNDRPHQFKLDGSYRWPFKLTTSASFRASSGIPFDALIPHELYGNNEGFGVQRGTATNPVTGNNRTPKVFNWDLGLAYPITVGEGKEFRLQLDWFNVTNRQSAIRQDTTLRINSGASGIPPVDNPFFGQGTIFQFPSAFRIGAKFKF